MKVVWDRHLTPALTRESQRMENATVAISGTICTHGLHRGTLNDMFVVRHRCINIHIKYTYALRETFYPYFRFVWLCVFPVCVIVCLCVALAAWCSSVAEKTMFFRAVKPSAAREWLKSSQPGATTDRSAKVRNSSQHTNYWHRSGRHKYRWRKRH